MASGPTSTKDTRLAFETIRIEGLLLQPEWLAKIARRDASSQEDADYRIPKGLNLRDEIGRYWHMARPKWTEFAAGQAAKADARLLSPRFIVELLKECLGFTSLSAVEPVVIAARSYPVGFAALGGRVPVVIAPAGIGLDTLEVAFGEQGRKRTAFGLVQELLNAAPGSLWGLVTDGRKLRIVRDNASLTRPAWIEVDLARIFTEDRYADFAAFWLLVHETRFGRLAEDVSAPQPTECPLEAWREAGRKEGVRARDRLRDGVKAALLSLGNGFLAHPDSVALRGALTAGTLTKEAYFQQLLRLVYRLIFLLTAEERELLHPADRTLASDAAKQLYARGYSVARLRERAVRRTAHDRYSDQWLGLRIVFRALANGEPRLGLPALLGLFAPTQTPDLDTATVDNSALLSAMFDLSWIRQAGTLSRVNWRDMGPEELGSVYESLLELVPVVSLTGATVTRFHFATGDETKGNARKTSGSYYTPDSLVQVLLDSALEPVIAETIAAHPGKEVEGLLSLAIVDPACGSGHFLLSAARRLAVHVARLRVKATPSAPEYRHALRQVIARCIYGVDLNPMAVELCRVALWMEAMEPGRPLTFLEPHIRHGNALLGTTPELMEKGIPDAAWEPIEGDDRKVASALKKRNGKEATGQTTMASLWSKPAVTEGEELATAVAELDAASDEDAGSLVAKESRWAQILASGAFRHQKFVADAWCAAFVWPKPAGGGPVVEAAPTMALWRDLRDQKGTPPALTVTTTEELAEQYDFFHWHLAFPTVFARGGFDVVLGNPPWERVTLKDKEWFSTRDSSVAGATTNAARLTSIDSLESSNPGLFREFSAAKRRAAGEKAILRYGGAYPLCGTGDINTFAVFAELGRSLCAGRTGMVLPTGVATADTTQDFIASLVRSGNLVCLYDFDNRSGIFPAVQGNVRFCLLSTARRAQPEFRVAAQLRGTAELLDPTRIWRMTSDDVRRINPNTLTLPLFPRARDAEVACAIYARHRCLDEVGAPHPGKWIAPMQRMLHMGDDSHLFRTERQLREAGFAEEGCHWMRDRECYTPLLEAKLCHQFDHRAGTFAGTAWEARFGTHPATLEMTAIEHGDPLAAPLPRYWVPQSEVSGRVPDREHLLAFRDAVSAVADSRSLVASIVPAHGAGDTLKFMFPKSTVDAGMLAAWLNAVATDYLFRLKASGAHASFFLLRQLPIPDRTLMDGPSPWAQNESVGSFLLPRVLELTYTAWDLEPFARDVGYDGPPYRWDPARRFLLRAELDAAFFHLYGLNRDDTDYILDTFPIVRKNDEKAHGEYRTKRVILEVYDAMAEASRIGVPYVARLDPPPADPRVAHPPRVAAPAPLLVPADWRIVPPREWRVPTFPTERERHVFALVAALRAFPTPCSLGDLLKAALLIEQPEHLSQFLPQADRARWQERTAAVSPPATTPSGMGIRAAWAEALRDLERRHLVSVSGGLWATGPQVGELDPTGYDCRAAVVVPNLTLVIIGAIATTVNEVEATYAA